MNTVIANITGISVAGKVKYITLEAHDLEFNVLVLESDSPSAQTGDSVKLLFKETEVSIGLRPDLEISLRNRIPGKISEIDEGELLSRISLDTKTGRIHSIITTSSVRRLRLSVGTAAVAFIKTNDIMLSRE